MPSTDLTSATQWIHRFLRGDYGHLTPLDYAEPHTGEVVSGVYAILAPLGVYVGESWDCWARTTLALAVRYGLPCGIIREMPGSTNAERRREESAVAKLYLSRGMPVISQYDP